MFAPAISTDPIRIVISAGLTFTIPVTRSRSRVGTRLPPRIMIVVTVKGSVVWTRFVTLDTSARPNGPGVGRVVKMSGLAGTNFKLPLYSTPLLLSTNGYSVPAGAPDMAGGTTKEISPWDTDWIPAATPLMASLTPLSSIGRLKRLASEPTAVRATTGGLAADS